MYEEEELADKYPWHPQPMEDISMISFHGISLQRGSQVCILCWFASPFSLPHFPIRLMFTRITLQIYYLFQGRSLGKSKLRSYHVKQCMFQNAVNYYKFVIQLCLNHIDYFETESIQFWSILWPFTYSSIHRNLYMLQNTKEHIENPVHVNKLSNHKE